MTTPTVPRPNWNRWTPDPHDPLQMQRRIDKDNKNRRDRARKDRKNQENKNALSHSSSSSVEEQVRKLQAAVETSSSTSAPASASALTTDPPVYLGMVSDDVFNVLDMETQTYEGKSMLVFPISAYRKHLWDFGEKMIKVYKLMKKEKRKRKPQAEDRRETG